MKSDSVFFICILIAVIFFTGKPNLLQALVNRVNGGDREYKRGVLEYHQGKVFYKDGTVYPVGKLIEFSDIQQGDTVFGKYNGDTLVIDSLFVPKNTSDIRYTCVGHSNHQWYSRAYFE